MDIFCCWMEILLEYSPLDMRFVACGWRSRSITTLLHTTWLKSEWIQQYKRIDCNNRHQIPMQFLSCQRSINKLTGVAVIHLARQLNNLLSGMHRFDWSLARAQCDSTIQTYTSYTTHARRTINQQMIIMIESAAVEADHHQPRAQDGKIFAFGNNNNNHRPYKLNSGTTKTQSCT